MNIPNCGPEPSFYSSTGGINPKYNNWSLCELTRKNDLARESLSASQESRASASQSYQQYLQTYVPPKFDYTPAPIPAADQANYWVSQHSEMLGAGAVFVLLLILIILTTVWVRRSQAKDRAVSRSSNNTRPPFKVDNEGRVFWLDKETK